ncbi:winged helix-turn-helix transcriptional regulator [Thermococcus sp. M39]|uniref:transcriptional regulator n=1 Tax=unclassified Thermococcus TaxID=2627626 RepID=UPI00143B36D3|nr:MULTISPECIES: winged helix-turn-helix transcriptional regulator [unclassified Thermococcus]NJE07742.1 winged helix-turn-helix transcriptional regulator [Thermococcus sp. M39]NJE12298.1 winged helix-turn-helix transcriptional regulator [Thermococcus sp. LS2]
MKTNAFEVAAKYVYPSLRRRLVEILYKEYKLTQTQVAELLHITQSAVSRYLRMNRGALIEVSKFPDIDEDLRKLAEEIIREKPSEYQIHAGLVKIALKMLGKGYLCSLHKKIDPELNPAECRICIDLFG